MYASFFQRLKAFLIDYLFILLYLALLFIVVVFLLPSIQNLFMHSLIQAQFIGFLIVTLPVSLYFIIFDSVIGKQSIGKRVLNLQVVNQQGLPLSLPQSIFRVLLKFTPWELSHFLAYRFAHIGDEMIPFHYYIVSLLAYGLLFTYILTAIFSKKQQSLYDLIANTYVVKIK